MDNFSDATDTDSLAETLRFVQEDTMEQVRVSLPARVESYDAERQVVNVTPLVGRFFRRGDGTEEAEALSVCVGVPVEWQGGGGAYLTFPLKPGDVGRLDFCDFSLDEWKQNGGQLVYARDNRLHHIADGVFRPGLRSPASPVRGVRGDAVVLGYEPQEGQPEPVRIHVTPDGIALGAENPPDAVLKGTTYRTAEDALLTALTTYLAAIVAGLPLPAPLAPATAAWQTALNTFKAGAHLSTTVKVKG